jgi:hypothetical protein
MTIRRSTSILLTGVGVALLIAAHGLVAWRGLMLSGTISASLPWIAVGALAVVLYHIIQASGAYHMVQHIRGKDHGHLLRSGEDGHGRAEVERGPYGGFLVNLGHGFVEITIVETDMAPRFRLFFHDKHKQVRAVPRNATVTLETVRPNDTRQMFDFTPKGEYLESTAEVPEPHEFKAIVRISHGSHTHTHDVVFRIPDTSAL